MSIELAFWRAPDRRIYAVKKSELREARLTLVTRWQASSENVNKASEAAESAEQTVSAQKLDDVVKGIEDIKQRVSDLSQRLFNVEKMKDILKCTVCQEHVFADIVITTCCGRVFGCYPCALQFMETTENFDCPLCQTHLDVYQVLVNGSNCCRKNLFRFRGADAIGEIVSEEVP